MFRNRARNERAVLVAVVLLLVPSFALAAAQDEEGLIVRASKSSYASVASLVASLGGSVTYQYDNVDALAVTVPKARVAELTDALGAEALSKDTIVAMPRPGAMAEVAAEGEPLSLSESAVSGLAALPQDYSFNNGDINATPLHAAGQTGNGVLVAVIDSGTANWANVAALAGTVIGGENFVPGATEPSATSRLNNAHGTWVGTMIAGHGLFAFAGTSALVQSLQIHAPSMLIPPGTAPCPGTLPATARCITMLGVAPSARIYALKVFPAPDGGAPESRIIAAMDRAITLRRNFNNGVPTTPVGGDGSENNPFVYNALNIEVVNMSLGGPTGFAGRDLEDQLTRTMIDVGMVLAVSAGNDGFAAMTGGSPGTGLGGLTTGASNSVVHERVLRDLQFGVGIGSLYRPTAHTQTADFSSRGPTADGRFDPDLTANGFASFAQGATGGISLVSGTSFSGPTVAGAAALLVGSNPSASPYQIRQALLLAANPNVLGDKSGKIDQGKGYLDVAGAKAKLDAGVPNGVIRDEFATPLVALNILKTGFVPVFFQKNKFSTRIKNLVPGQVAQLFVPSDFWTDKLVVKLTNIVPEKAPADQNQLFGDDVFVNVADAPTSFAALRVGQAGGPNPFVNADTTFTIDNPQTGLVRVALQGDSTNAGKISADITIERTRGPQGLPSAVGRIAQGETIPFEVTVPAGAASAVFELSWLQNWGIYPANDLDMVLIDPNGVVNTTGAASNSPERVAITNPVGGTWQVQVSGFTIHGLGGDDDDPEAAQAASGQHWGHYGSHVPTDRFALRVTVDGARIRVD